jgi:hypothetical protein
MAHDVGRLRELLAPTLQDPRAREAFLRPPSGHSQPVSRPARAPSSASVPLHSRSDPSGSAPLPGRTAATAEELAVIEAALSRHIGPIGRVLARKENVRHTSLRDYVHAVAGNIDKAEQREVFMQELRRHLPRRPKA